MRVGNRHDFQGHFLHPAQFSAKSRPFVRVGTELMVHMDGRKLELQRCPQLHQDMEQHDRVDAPGEAQGELLTRLNPGY